MLKKILSGFATLTSFGSILACIIILMNQDQVSSQIFGYTNVNVTIRFVPMLIEYILMFLLILVTFIVALANKRIATLVLSLVSVCLFAVLMLPMNILSAWYSSYYGTFGAEYLAKYSTVVASISQVANPLLFIGVLLTAIVAGASTK